MSTGTRYAYHSSYHTLTMMYCTEYLGCGLFFSNLSILLFLLFFFYDNNSCWLHANSTRYANCWQTTATRTTTLQQLLTRNRTHAYFLFPTVFPTKQWLERFYFHPVVFAFFSWVFYFSLPKSPHNSRVKPSNSSSSRFKWCVEVISDNWKIEVN